MTEDRERNKACYQAEAAEDESSGWAAHKKWKHEQKELRRRHRHKDAPGFYLFAGLLLILIAVVVFLYQMHYISSSNWLAVFLIGLGAILIVTGIRRIIISRQQAFMPIRLIGGGIVLCYGVALLLGVSNWWPLALVVAGLALLFTFIVLQQEARKRRIVQETLHESEVKYVYIIDNANSIIMEVDPAGKITFMNKFARDFFGFDAGEIAGHAALGTIVQDEVGAAGSLETMLGGITTHPENYLHYETENMLNDGRKVSIAWSCKPVFDDDSNLKEVLCIGIDRTEQKKTEELAAQQLQEKTAVEERTRLARDLHDAVSQTLFSASLIADVLPRVWERNEDEGLKRLEELRQLTRGSLAEMRTLLFELRPAALADADLGELLRQLAEAVNGRARLPVSVEIEGRCEIPVDVKIAFYRIAQEALNNMARHSGAAGGRVTLQCRPDKVEMHIADDGHGFDMEQAAGGFGLGNMRERAGQVGAALKVESKINQGTWITVIWQNKAGETEQ